METAISSNITVLIDTTTTIAISSNVTDINSNNNNSDCAVSFGSWPAPAEVRNGVWAILLATLSAVNILVIVSFEIFVLCKSCGSQRRHLFLGQMLLLGLFICSALGLAFLPTSSWITCTVTRVGIGLAYTLVFATLMVKCVFLLSLSAGTYLPASYQGLLLFFTFAVQIVVSVQWIVFRPPGGALNCTDYMTDRDVLNKHVVCSISPKEFLLTLIYPMFLLLVVAILSLRVRTLRENHREGAFIGVAILLAILIWVAWTTIAMVILEYHEIAMALGLVVTTSVVFLVMFLPKGRQLATMGRDGMLPEERDGISSVNHSVYTPSFLHLKPNSVLINKHGTLVKQTVNSDREMYLSPPGRVWRYGCSSYPQMSLPHDGVHFYPGERPQIKKPNVTFVRTPLY